jgi:hypothetical protein
MRALWISAVVVGACMSTVLPVAAQQAPPPVEAPPAPAPPPSGLITTAPSRTYVQPPPPAYTDYDLQEAKERSRRTRVALIATSAIFGVGVIIAGIGASQCDWITQPGSDQYVCNNTGDVMVPLGGSLAGLSAIGMITSGAMLGVRNRNKREIERDIRRRYYGGRLRWDVESGRFVF